MADLELGISTDVSPPQRLATPHTTVSVIIFEVSGPEMDARAVNKEHKA